MPITKLNPNTIWLGGHIEVLDDPAFPASAAITPGMLVEMFDDSGDPKFRANSSATAQVPLSVALEREEFNKTIDDAYALGDAVKVGYLAPGSTFFGLVPSGNTVNAGTALQSNGDGKLQAAGAVTAAANTYKFQSLSALGVVTADTRCRVQVIQ